MSHVRKRRREGPTVSTISSCRSLIQAMSFPFGLKLTAHIGPSSYASLAYPSKRWTDHALVSVERKSRASPCRVNGVHAYRLGLGVLRGGNTCVSIVSGISDHTDMSSLVKGASIREPFRRRTHMCFGSMSTPATPSSVASCPSVCTW